MRRLVLLLLVASAGPAQAQLWGRSPDRIAERGDVALTFTADDVWGGFDNGGVGLRAWLGERLVGSASVGVGFDRTDTEFGPDVERHEVGLALGLEAHLGGSRSASPFIGGGVRLGYAQVDGASPYVYSVSCLPEARCDFYPGTAADERSVGLGIDVGAEIRLARGVTLLGAHRIGATFVSGETEAPVYFPGDPEVCPFGDCGFFAASGQDYTRWRIGTGETRVVLSIYL